MSRRCLSRWQRLASPDLEDGEILALDGTRVDCNSENISLAAVGKKKMVRMALRSTFPLVINVKNGEPALFIEPTQATFPTCSTLERSPQDVDGHRDFREVASDSHGSRLSESGGVRSIWDRDGYRFLIGAKTSMKLVKDVIDQKNCEFYDQKTYLREPLSPWCEKQDGRLL